jgi:uncharacterized protein
MNTITYSLCTEDSHSDLFYNQLRLVTDEVTSKAESFVGETISDFYGFIEENQIEIPRTRDEYILESLMIGVLWQNYIEYAYGTSKTFKLFLIKLYSFRSKNKNLKPFIDSIRGVLSGFFLNKKSYLHDFSFSIENFSSLIEWLQATSEFNEEVKRLKNWQLFFISKNKTETSKDLLSFSEFAVWFEIKCQKKLGAYTCKVADYINIKHAQYRFREDYFFTGRKENEYHLNMVGAEIINRQQRAKFQHSPRKVVLLPTCMRNISKEKCKAHFIGDDLVCSHCRLNCNVDKITREMGHKGAEVYLIAHSSDFTKSLERWKMEPNVGLVGVACILNLLTGGYEMKELDIASQCVFLDYCGCKKHWDKKGISTQLNLNQLNSIVSTDENSNNKKIDNLSALTTMNNSFSNNVLKSYQSN